MIFKNKKMARMLLERKRKSLAPCEGFDIAKIITSRIHIIGSISLKTACNFKAAVNTLPFAHMALLLHIHPDNPNARLIEHAVACLRNGGVIIYPTDTIYGLGCSIYEHKAIEKIARIK